MTKGTNRIRDRSFLASAAGIVLSSLAFPFPVSAIPIDQARSLDTAAYARFNDLFDQSDVDGLLALSATLASSGDPSDRALGLLALAGGRFRGDDVPGCSAALDSLERSPKPLDPHVLAVGNKIRAQVLLWAGDQRGGLSAVDRGLGYADSISMAEEYVVLLIIAAELHMAEGDFASAYRELTPAERTAERAGFTRGKCLIRLNLGNIRYHQQRYDEALIDYKAVLNMALPHDWRVLADNALNNMGSAAIMLGRYDEALTICDSLLHALGPQRPELRVSLLAHIGYIHREGGDPSRAISYLEQAIALGDSIGDVRGSMRASQHLASALWGSSQPERAIALLEATLRIAVELKATQAIADMEWDLHDWYRAIGKHEASLTHMESYCAVMDSLNETRYATEVARSEVLYGTERKSRRIAEQQQALLLAKAEDRRKALQRNVSIGAAILLAIITFLLWRASRSRQRLAGKERQLLSEQVDKLIGQQELKSINAMLEGQEKERDRMARDLHDRLGSMLSAIKVNMNAMEVRLDQMRQDRQYLKVAGLLDEAVKELRRISHDMAAGTLSRFGLEKALRDLRDTVHISGRLSVELKAFGLEHRLERSVEIAAYRIVQELMSNVLKHASASEVSIAVTRTPGRLNVMVTDDGIGFDPTHRAPGIGLENVRSRAAGLGGSMMVDSHPGKGTTVSVECPIVE